MAISRSREFEADRSGSELTGSPLTLASALSKLDQGTAKHPMEVGASASTLFIADPFAVQTQDRALFETQLRLILDAPDDLFPEQELMNQVAKARARLLLERIDELFL